MIRLNEKAYFVEGQSEWAVPEKSVDVIKVFDRVDGSTLHRKAFERGQYLRNCYTEEKGP